jgi:hypothetical protein
VYPWLRDVVSVTANGSVVPGVSDGLLSLALAGNSTLCLVSRVIHRGSDGAQLSSFQAPVGVFIGSPGMRMLVNISLSNSTHVCGRLPSSKQLCAGDTTCLQRGAFMNFTIINGYGVHAVESNSSGVNSKLPMEVMGTLSCPPDCPAPSRGLYLTEYCGASPPSGDTCLNPRTAASCFLGTPPDCARCPDGALCPGGWQLWPQAGYWVSDVSAVTALQCGFPATERCLGWDIANNSMHCGVGYDPAAPLCGACLSGWYPDSSGCWPCPQRPAARYSRVIVAVCLFVALALGSFVAVLAVMWSRQGRVSKSVALFRAVRLVFCPGVNECC